MKLYLCGYEFCLVSKKWFFVARSLLIHNLLAVVTTIISFSFLYYKGGVKGRCMADNEICYL